MVEKEKMVQEVFKNISNKYDFFDSLMSFGMDKGWRRKVVDLLNLQDGLNILDAGAGSGKVSEEMISRGKNLHIEALDITREMFPGNLKGVHFNLASADSMPFENNIFDRAVSCFLTRNVPDLDKYLSEVFRVTKKGAIFCNMDIFDPGNGFIAPVFRVYFYRLVPAILDRASGTRSYSYLASSVKNFVSPETFHKKMIEAGFKDVNMYRLAGGTVYIHRGIKE